MDLPIKITLKDGTVLSAESFTHFFMPNLTDDHMIDMVIIKFNVSDKTKEEIEILRNKMMEYQSKDLFEKMMIEYINLSNTSRKFDIAGYKYIFANIIEGFIFTSENQVNGIFILTNDENLFINPLQSYKYYEENICFFGPYMIKLSDTENKAE